MAEFLESALRGSILIAMPWILLFGIFYMGLRYIENMTGVSFNLDGIKLGIKRMGVRLYNFLFYTQYIRRGTAYALGDMALKLSIMLACMLILAGSNLIIGGLLLVPAILYKYFLKQIGRLWPNRFSLPHRQRRPRSRP